MSDSFKHHFMSMLSARVGALDADVSEMIAALIDNTIIQHSCLDLRDKPAEFLGRLAEQKMIGAPGEETPLTLSGHKLYLSRLYRYEQKVADLLIARNVALEVDQTDLKEKLNMPFGEAPGDRQKLAALLAITRRLAIITGGPGTGKTSTVIKILNILLEKDPGLEVRLVAPTGKAAMRLEESTSMPALTLHRLLGMRPDRRSWRHGQDNPIIADLLVVDEASMIDLMLMHRLLVSLPEHTRLVLLGDPQQLPSVDTGNVLADICAGDTGFSTEFAAFANPILGEVPLAVEQHRLTDAICQLQKNYRFTTESGVGQIAIAIQQEIETINDLPDGSVKQLPAWQEGDEEQLLNHWPAYIQLLTDHQYDADELLSAFEQARILCTRRGGATGVEQINERIEAALRSRGLKAPREEFYPGRPIIIKENNYNLGLFNGDVGICVPFADGDQYKVVFPGGEEKQYPASRLPAHETCFAMTVHKSQGSEFEHVVLILANETGQGAQSLMTRELLYTAVTRAKQRLTVHTDPETWRGAIHRSSARVSGMAEFLGISPDGDE